MPIQIQTRDPEELAPHTDGLFDESGNLTLEGQIIDEFLEQMNYDNIFDDEDVRQIVTVENTYGKLDDELDCYVECAADDPDAEELVVESIDAEDMAELIDENDLSSMFAYYVQHELPTDTLAERTIAEVAYGLVDPDHIDIDQLDEKGPFKKGDFRKLHKSGGAATVNRYLGAMIAKGVIKRAKASQPGKPRKAPTPGFDNQGGVKGAGYKGGDYQKAAGYPSGTKPRVAIWRKFKIATAAKAAKTQKASIGQKTTVGGKKKTSAKAKEIIAKIAQLKKGGGSKAVKIASKKAARAKGKSGGKAKSIADSLVTVPSGGLLSETASLAAAAIARQNQRPVNESAPVK